MLTYEQVFENNKNWLFQKKLGNLRFFDDLSTGQNPDFLYIGCSDSRVPAEQFMGAQPGEVFVHRNVANVVNSADLNASSVIEYAVGHLEVEHIIVCGHYQCGGVASAMENNDAGMLNPWLQNIRDVYRLHREELDKIVDVGARYDRLVERNVEEQCLNVYKMAVVQKAIHGGYRPKIHAWVFNVKSGEIIDLKLDLEKKLSNKQGIYDLGFEK
jgi:carbonic anhydrase